MYDIVLVIESIFGFNPSEAKDKALKIIKERKIEKSDLDCFCHQADGSRKKV